MADPNSRNPIDELPVDLNRDLFMRTLIRHLAGSLEDTVGLAEASGFISVVGQAMGEEILAAYRKALNKSSLESGEVAEVLVDLKRRIGGDFYVAERDDDKIVFGNRACPFGDRVIGRKSMCMMTSNVFGHIAAQNHGYAKVELEKTIADGHPQCRVVVHVRPSASTASVEGREYFESD